MRRYTQLLYLLCFLFGGNAAAQQINTEVATFAAGCVWCAQQAFDNAPGVVETVVGYSGGAKVDATYNKVSSGRTSHIESIQVHFDPTITSYQQLLITFWINVDPTVKDRQFCDRGRQYSSAIFLHNAQQSQTAVSSSSKVASILGASHTLLIDYQSFYKAEEYHQKYYKKNPIRYSYYKYTCGREKRLNAVWGKDNVEKLTDYLSRNK